jgi:hypothetical protein
MLEALWNKGSSALIAYIAIYAKASKALCLKESYPQAREQIDMTLPACLPFPSFED